MRSLLLLFVFALAGCGGGTSAVNQQDVEWERTEGKKIRDSLERPGK